MPFEQIQAFEASDGYRLHYRHWLPSGAVRGRIVALHGIQSHSAWYRKSSEFLRQLGYEIFFLDRRGSGLNERERGHAPHAERLLSDVTQFMTQLKRDRVDEDLATVLMSVSWGGKLAVATAARRPDLVDSLAVLYPGICPRLGPAPPVLARLAFLALVGVRKRRVPIPLEDPALFTDDQHWQSWIRNDPLALRQVSIAFLMASRRLDRLALRMAEQVRCPSLVMLAGKDRIINNDQTRKIAARFAGPTTLIEYPHSTHTLEFDRNCERFMHDLAHWLNHATSTSRLG